MSNIASETNFDNFESDWQARTDPASLRPFVDVVRSCPTIPRIMRYATFGGLYNGTLRSDFWGHLEDCVTFGRVQDITNPIDTGGYVYDPFGTGGAGAFPIGRLKLVECIGAKWAHALWVEANRFFPWRLNKNTERGLTALFDPEYLFRNPTGTDGSSEPLDWDSATLTYFEWSLIDHSPYRAWDIVGTGTGGLMEDFTGIDQLDAAKELAYYVAQNWSHSSTDTVDYLNTVTVSDAFDPDVNKVLRGDEPRAPRSKFCSRTGCTFAGRLWPAILRAINIPANVEKHMYYGGHHSAYCELNGTGYGLMHSDDLYNGVKAPIGPGSGVNSAGELPAWFQKSPLGFMVPYDNQAGENAATESGWTEDWVGARGYAVGTARDNWTDRNQQRQSFGARVILYAEAGRIFQYDIDDYLANGWATFAARDGNTSTVTAANDAVKARLIKITGQDIP